MESAPIKLKNDVAFKAAFGRESSDCKKALRLILNRILERKKDPIIDIVYMNPFNIREAPDRKESVMDIKVRTQLGEIIDIEMQLYFEQDFVDRGVYYTSTMVHNSVDIGDDYDILKKCISIYFVDFVLFESRETYHTRFALRTSDGFRLTEKVEMHYIELPKVNPKGMAPEELTETQRLLEYLRCAGVAGKEEYVSKLLRQRDEEVIMAEEMLKKVTAEEILREKAIAREKFLWQQRSFKRDREEAIAGMKEALEKKEIAIAEKEDAIAEKEDAIAEKEELLGKMDEARAKIHRQLREKGLQESEINEILQAMK